MKCPLHLLSFFALLLFAGVARAQAPHTDTVRYRVDSARLQNDTASLTDTAKAGAAGAATYKDDGFDPAVFVVLVGVIGGAAIIGMVAAALVLLGLFLMASVGILSAGVLVGLYRSSVTAGFKTIFYLACAAGGIAIGTGGLYLVNHFFHFHISYKNILLIGAGGGLLGGLVLGLVVFQIIKLLFWFFRERLAI